MRGKIGLLFALKQEAQGFEKVMAESRLQMCEGEWSTTWRIGGIELICAVSGIGRKKCASATLGLIESGAESVICAGFAAALHPNARVGDVFAADRIILRSDTNHPAISTSRDLAYAVPPYGPNGSVIRHVGLVTSDEVVMNASDKVSLFHSTGAAILDMESYAAASVCNQMNVPFLAIRSVSDTALQDIPNQIADLILIDNPLGQAAYAVCRPQLWLYLVKLKSQANLAAGNLGDTIATMLLRLI